MVGHQPFSIAIFITQGAVATMLLRWDGDKGWFKYASHA